MSSHSHKEIAIRLSMSHLRGSSIGALGHKRNSEYLFTVVAGHLHRIVIWILYFLLFDPKELSAFRTFSNEHGHSTVSIVIRQCHEGSSLDMA